MKKQTKKESKINIGGEIKVNIYLVLTEMLEQRIAFGYQHAFKHTDTPDPEKVKEDIYQEVLNGFCELFYWENPND